MDEAILAHRFDVAGGGSRVETPEGTTSQRVLGLPACDLAVTFSGPLWTEMPRSSFWLA